MPTTQKPLDGDDLITGQQLKPGELDRVKALRRQLTPAEKALWTRLKAGRLGAHFRRQQVIAGYIADFYCHSARLVIEVDGGIHEMQEAYDRFRDEQFAALGLTVARFSNEEVLQNEEQVVEKIRGLLRRS